MLITKYAQASTGTLFAASIGIAFILFYLMATNVVWGQTQVTLQVQVQSSISFSVSTNNFPNLTPGTPVYATSTLTVSTNSSTGYNITLYGNDKSTTDTVMDLTTDPSVNITDQTEWIPGGGSSPSTTTPGNAVLKANLDNSGKVLAFRVMASSSPKFYASAWWGSDDTDANALWAGIASSTVERMIGKSGVYDSNTHIITVQYYLDVPASQQAGTYSGVITYTATVNP